MTTTLERWNFGTDCGRSGRTEPCWEFRCGCGFRAHICNEPQVRVVQCARCGAVWQTCEVIPMEPLANRLVGLKSLRIVVADTPSRQTR